MKDSRKMKIAKIALALGVLGTVYVPNQSSAAISPMAVSPSGSETIVVNVPSPTGVGTIPFKVNLKTSVNIQSTTSSAGIVATKREVVSQVDSKMIAAFPNVSMSPGVLNLRGAYVSLTKNSSFITQPGIVILGKYNDSSQTYKGSPSAAYATTNFDAGAGTTQNKKIVRVSFNW